ncbi:MAG: indolepyruvate ferredoxin oxidoreductase [Acidobacteria bacterium]|nr:indolepyruvate ferredoxin oxidoreductase [Acidobacteriota bacterium]
MTIEVLLGDEAVARGAIDAGISGAFSYPGTPATEIFEYVERYNKKANSIHAVWSANEKVAFEEALGMSYMGKRALTSMKHVGLNVAADPFMNSAITGVGGGLVIALGDDPGQHSSQNEQDSRVFARFALVFCFEPSNQQEAYDLTRLAYETSEKFELPVLMRLVTRLAHSRAGVTLADPKKQNEIYTDIDWKKWNLLPAVSRVKYKTLTETIPKMHDFSDECKFNKLEINDKKLGVIVSGIAYNYFMEVFETLETKPSYLKISTYPEPLKKIQKLYDTVDEIMIIEEGYPMLEDSLRGLLNNGPKKILGRHTGHIPRTGELNPDFVYKALTGKEKKPIVSIDMKLPGRPPALCKGCPHADTYKALNAAKEMVKGQVEVFSDIGCYTLGALPPYNAIKSCVDMGASISMCKGAADAGLKYPVAVIGDSTFGHSGMTPLIGAAQEGTSMTVMILDNLTTAMTGGQHSLTTGHPLIKVLEGLGVEREHIKVIEPLPKNHDENAKIMKEEMEYEGLSVIIADRECVQTLKKSLSKKKKEAE